MKLTINSSCAGIKHELRYTCTSRMPLWHVQGPLCLQAMNFNVSVAYRLPARSSLKVSKEMEVTRSLLPAGHVTGYGDPVGKLWTALPTDPNSHHVTFIYWDR